MRSDNHHLQSQIEMETTTVPCHECGMEVNVDEKTCPRCNAVLKPDASSDPKYPSLDDNSGRVRQHDSGLTDEE